MQALITILVLILLVPYVLGPVLVKLSLRIRSRPELQALAAEALPREVYEYFGRTAQGLMACRFTICSYFQVTDQVPNVVGYVALWINRTCGQAATSVVLISKAGAGFKVQRYVEFLTKPVSGPAVLTNNTRELQSFKIDPAHKDVASLPKVEDVAALYQVHLNREARLIRPDAPRYLPPQGQEMSFFTEAVARDVEDQVATGRLFNPSADVHRATWPGAVAMTYGQIFPIKQFRQAARNRRAAGELAAARPMPFFANARITEQSPYE